jgi:hypothetical protein
MDKNNDYYKHVINKPDKITFTNKYPDILVINSDDRNKFLYPNSNNFSLGFNNTFNDVVEIELINAYFKYTNYLVNSNNNKIFINNLTETFDLRLPQGNYTKDTLISTFLEIYNSKKEFKTLNFDLTLKYNIISNKFYFINNTNMNEYKLLFKGIEQKYPSGLFGNPVSNTNIYNYKKNTNGKIFGFSTNDFSNKFIPNTLEIDLIDLTDKKYKLILNCNNNTEAINFENILFLFDTGHNIKFTNSLNVSFTVNDSNILGFERNNNILEIIVKLSTTTLEEIINTPNIYTNIILGDIVSNLESPNFVLLDIDQCNRIKSNNTNMDGSYLQIPINNKISFDVYHLPGSLKHFNPPLRKFDRFHIKIRDLNGVILDDNGSNFTLVFGIRSLNNSHIY